MSDPGKLDVLWAIPTRGQIRHEWHIAANTVYNPMNCSVQQRWISNNTVQDARNLAVQAMYELDAEYLWFLDDDVVAPPPTLANMMGLLEKNPEFSVCSAIVPTKSHDPEPCIYRGRPGAFWHWTAGEHFEIDQCGMGCALIRKDAFDKLAEPWFTWEKSFDMGGYHVTGEDIGFCERLRKVNCRLMADGGTICGHIAEDGELFVFPADIPPFKRGAKWIKSVKSAVPA